MRLRFYIFLVVLIFAALGKSRASAQSRQLPVEVFSLEQGLSHWVIRTMIQDSKGYLWIGTEGGLNRYNGEDFQVFVYDLEDSSSLANNYVSALHESFENGESILWVGSEGGGLSRYVQNGQDRGVFINHRSDPADEQSICDDYVSALSSNKDGLWIGTSNGLCLLRWRDLELRRFTRFPHDPDNPFSLADDKINALFTDDDDVLWVGTAFGLSRLSYDGKGEPYFTNFRANLNNSKSLIDNDVNTIHQTKTKAGDWLWVGTEAGLSRLNLPLWQAGRFDNFHHDPADSVSLAGASIQAFGYSMTDGRQELWIGTSRGLSRLSLQQADEQPKFENYYTEFGAKSGLSDDYIHAILVDHSGIVWIGADDGLNKYNAYQSRFASYTRDLSNQGGSTNVIDALITTKENNEELLWLGVWGRGFSRMKRDREDITAFHYFAENSDLPEQLQAKYIRAFAYSEFLNGKHLWIGTDDAGLFQLKRDTPDKRNFVHFKRDEDDRNSLIDDQVRALLIAPDQQWVWVGTAKGLSRISFENDGETTFTNYTQNARPSLALADDEIKALCQTHMFGQWMLWIGTDGGGLARLFVDDIGEEVMQIYKHHPGDSKSLRHNIVRTILAVENEDGRKTLWIGTDQGLSRLEQDDIESGRFTHYTSEDGLPSNKIVGLLSDARGRLWLSTSRGISRFDPKNEKFRNYSVIDGLQSWEFNQGAFYKSLRGEMYFGGEKGFNVFHPDSIRDNPHPPKIVLTAFRVLDQPVTPTSKDSPLTQPISETESIELTHKQNVFSFEFRGLHFSEPEKIRYRYFLIGYDRSWRMTDANQRIARYSNVSAGEYIFLVSAANSDGVWNDDPIQIKIKITPPFWQTWPFLSLLAFVIALIGYSGYRLILSSKLEKARIRNELNTAQKIQMGLMPQAPPQVEGLDIAGVCKPAEEVGGDYFDYIWLDEAKTKVGIAVVDVSGKAMAGAMTAVMTSGMIYGEAGRDNSPKMILRKINRPLFLKTDPMIFTAMLFAAFDTNKKTLTFSNAGQTPPVLIRNGTFEYMKVNGVRFPLGLQKNVLYDETSIALQRGDVVIFYTDGIPEAMNAKHEEFDYFRIEMMIKKLTPNMSADGILNAFIHEVEAFAGRSRQHDDITLVVVKAG